MTQKVTNEQVFEQRKVNRAAGTEAYAPFRTRATRYAGAKGSR